MTSKEQLNKKGPSKNLGLITFGIWIRCCSLGRAANPTGWLYFDTIFHPECPPQVDVSKDRVSDSCILKFFDRDKKEINVPSL